MDTSKPKSTVSEFSRREFLLTVGTGAPTLSMMTAEPGETAQPAVELGAKPEVGDTNRKFTSIDLSSHFNTSSREFGPRVHATSIGGATAKDFLIRVQGGKRDLLGIPFQLGPEGLDSKAWLQLSTKPSPTASPQAVITVQQKAHFLCLGSFTDFDQNEAADPGVDVYQKVGQRMADVTLVYDNNETRAIPIRRRYESNGPAEFWGHLSYASLRPDKSRATNFSDPLTNGYEWGNLQMGQGGTGLRGPGIATIWICALANPEPDRTIREVRLEAAGEDALVVCGLTLYHRPEYPLRYEPRALYRITLPEAAGEEADRWHVDADLGSIGRTFALPDFHPEAWLASPSVCLGEESRPGTGTRYLYVEVTANTGATLTLQDKKLAKQYSFELSRAMKGGEIEASEGAGRIEIIEPGKTWVHGRVVDADTKKPTPVRMALRSKEGRYIPPYGHRQEVNNGWFQDYGADLKLMDTSFAYIDGTFQVELPPGESYLEISKGFEYQAVRHKLEIQPGQREVTVEIPRLTNLRTKGWVTADTHTHFLCPTTGLLEAQAEGLNLINLLAAQWGDLFTNVGDLFHGPVVSADGEAMVCVGSENRQHLLGHISLEGFKGAPVFPLSADGPGESYMGEPLWTTLAEWADVCRERQGLVVAPHFPYPTGEIAADIVLGKIDAVEIWPQDDPINLHASPYEEFDSLRYRDWYRYLNCGYRLPVVGGTDKMGAFIAAGASRAYAYLGQEEFNFPNFAKTVRSGNTFVTSGPLLMLRADGHVPGAEITLGAGGGTIEVTAEAQCYLPFHRLEIVYNGKVVAKHEDPAGARSMRLAEKIKVPGPGWIAARCASKLGPTTRWRFKIEAHTSPVYVRVPGQDLLSAEAATYFLKLIDGAQYYVDTLAIRPDPAAFAKVRKVFTDAHEALHQRLHQHGIAH